VVEQSAKSISDLVHFGKARRTATHLTARLVGDATKAGERISLNKQTGKATTRMAHHSGVCLIRKNLDLFVSHAPSFIK